MLTGIKLTDRDIQILEFINDFGFCEITHIARQFQLNQSRSYQIMQRLSHAKLVQSESIFSHRHGVFTLTKLGAKFTDMPPIHRVPLTCYKHHLQVIAVSQKLSQVYPDSTWITERRLIIDNYMGNSKKRGHIADGFICFPLDEKPIAVEVELTAKKRSRIEKILKGYGGNFDIKEVWYFCTKETFKLVTSLALKKNFVKIFNISEFLNG